MPVIICHCHRHLNRNLSLWLKARNCRFGCQRRGEGRFCFLEREREREREYPISVAQCKSGRVRHLCCLIQSSNRHSASSSDFFLSSALLTPPPRHRSNENHAISPSTWHYPASEVRNNDVYAEPYLNYASFATYCYVRNDPTDRFFLPEASSRLSSHDE